MENSNIGWCHHTENFWLGCSKKSPGCLNCYAEELMDKRYGRVNWGPGNPRQRTTVKNWNMPFRWNRQAAKKNIRERVFCSSLSDFFDEEVDPSWRKEAWEIIRQTTNLDWLVLTKRPENIFSMLPEGWGEGWSNVWLGASAENQEMVDERFPILSSVPAKVRFISAEPLLGPISIPKNHLIDWIIVGGESGPGSRPMELEWADSVRVQCEKQNVKFFFKQTGTVYAKNNRLSHKKGEDLSELPSHIQIQQFPKSSEPNIQNSLFEV